MSKKYIKWIPYLLIVIAAFSLYDWSKTYVQGMDYILYHEAAKGNFDFRLDDGYEGIDRYMYKRWIAFIWKPYAMFGYDTGRLLWYITLVIFGLLTVRKIQEIECCGILVSLFYAYPFALNLLATNVCIVLVYLALFPFLSYLPIFVKPYYAIYTLLHILAKKIKPRYAIPAIAVMALITVLVWPNEEMLKSAPYFYKFDTKAHMILALPIYYHIKKYKFIK